MSVLKLSKNDIIKNNDSGNKIKLKRDQLSYDSAMASDWEKTNKTSLETLNNYNKKLSKNEWMSADDLTAYRNALDSYIDTGNRLRTLSKNFGGTYTEEDEKNWTDFTSNAYTDYDNMSNHYSQWATEKEYKDAIRGQKEYEELLAFDTDAGKSELDEIDTILGEALELENKIYSPDRESMRLDAPTQEEMDRYYEIVEYFTQKGIKPMDIDGGLWETDRGYILNYEGVQDYILGKEQYIKAAQTTQKETKLRETALNSVDFEEYAQKAVVVDLIEDDDLEYANENELKVYKYYLGKGDTESAEEYYKIIAEYSNQREGQKKAEWFQEHDLEWLLSINAGLDQFWSGVTGAWNAITGDDSYTPTSSVQYASAKVREDIDSSVAGFFYDLGTTISNQLPSILTSVVTGGLGGSATAASTAGLTTMGVSVYGNAYTEMINLGYSKEQANGYAVLVTASELGLQKLIGGYKYLGGSKLSKGVTEAFASKFDNALAKFAIRTGGSMIGEGFEEAIQSVLEPAFKTFMTGDHYSVDLSEVWYSGLLGAFSAGALEGIPSGIVSGVNAISNARNTKAMGKTFKSRGDVEALKSFVLDEANKFSADSVAYKLAGKVNEKTSAYKIGKLLREADAFISEQNKADITKSLTDKGVLPKDAERYVNAISAYVAGYELTEDQIAALNTHPAVQKALVEVLDNNSTVNQRLQGYTEAIKLVKAKPESAQNETAQDGSTNASTEAVTSENTAQNSVYNYSADGKTIYNNEDVSVKEISSIKDGEVFVRLEDGREVNAKEVSFSTQEEALMYEMVADLGVAPEATTTLMNSYNRGKATISAQDFRADGALAYKYGLIGYTKGLVNLNLTGDQKVELFGLGQKQAKKNAEALDGASKNGFAKEKSLKFEGKKTKKNGLTYIGIDPEYVTKDVQKASIVGAEILANSSNLDIILYESYRDENGNIVVKIDGKVVPAPNGMFREGNRIYLDINAGDNQEGTILYTLSHEVGHYIRKWNANAFKELGDFLFEHYEGEISVDKLIGDEIKVIKKRYKAEGKALPSETTLYDMAYEEVVCNAFSELLADENAYIKLAELKKQNKSLWAKIGEAIKAFLDKLKKAIGIYSKYDPSIKNEAMTKKMTQETFNKLQDMYIKAFVEADANYSQATNETLSNNGIMVDTNTESASLYSVRDLLDGKQQKQVAKALAERFDVTLEEAQNWISAETSLASIILNPKYSQYLDYTADPNEEAIKKNSDYPQGTVDFSNICKKRRDFTDVMNRVLRRFPNHVFSATDLAKIRTIMDEEGMEVACHICYVEDRRQLDSIVAQDFIDSLALYREGSKTRPDGKPFNTNQLKALKMIDGDAYTPSIYELISLEGRNVLKAKNPAMEQAWVKFNNARGMQSVRLLLNDAEYKRQILKYSPDVVKRKNDYGGLRIYSFSDMEMFHLIDIIQVITDSATVGLSIQGYTKVNEYARAVKDTGEKLNRSLIPKGDLGYHMENGRVVLDYDTVEGIDINHPDFFDSTDNPNVGNIVIGINETQIKAAMVDKFIDYIIPFHTGQSKEVLGEKGIAEWNNYEDSQSERDIATGKKSSHQINIYTEVIQAAEKEGKPITNKVEFVNKFLAVCKENGLKPRFSEFLNIGKNGEYVYTEGYHKFLVDFKTFDSKTGEYLPQIAVKPIFDSEYLTSLLKDYVKSQQEKDAKLAETMPTVLERITNEIVKSDTKYSTRETSWRDVDKIQGLEDYSVEEVTDMVRQHIENLAMDMGEEISIIDIRPYGSRARGTAKNSSDLDVVVQYEGDIREDDMFNMLNDEDKLVIDGIEVDINPIKADDTGTIEEYLDRVYGYDKYTDAKYSVRESEQAAKDFAAYMKDITNKRGWRSSDVYDYVEAHPELNFIERIYEKDKQVKNDLASFLEGINDTKTLDSLSWFLGGAYSDKGYSWKYDYDKRGIKSVYPYSGAVRTFRNAIKKRINAIMTEKVGGTNLGVKNGEYSLYEVKELFNQINSNTEIGELADKVFATAKTLGVNIRFANAMFDPKSLGVSLGDMIEYKTSYFNDTSKTDQSKASTILHELIHACTVYVMDTAKTVGERIDNLSSEKNKKLLNAAVGLNKIYHEILKDSDFNGQYALKNAKEMVAELSNPNFVDLLKKKNLWERIVDWICNLFGIKRGTSAYDNAKLCLDYILDNPDYASYKIIASYKRDQARRDGLDTFGETKYSLRDVAPIEPTSNNWKRTLTTAEVKAKFPDLWDVSADESEVRNPTQISGTVRSYRKVYDFLKKTGFKGTILDASSGLGYGTKAGIEEYGFNVDDIEPYPDKSYKPKYTDYSKLNKKYDVIISNAVLNVIPQDQRDALVVKMGELLKDGGRMFINVRGDDVKNASSKVAINEDLMEYYISNTGSYQKGFKKAELVAYLQDALGEGYSVMPTTFFGKTSAVVTKKEGQTMYSVRESFASQVDDVLNGNFPRGNAVYVGETPKILQDVGLNGDIPMLTTARHIRKAVLPKDEKLHNHGLTIAQLKSIPEKIAHPVMIMDSLTEANCVVVVTDMTDSNGDPIVVAVKADGKGMYNNVEIMANFMLSYYPKANFHNFIDGNIAADSILFIDKEKSRELSNQAKVQFFGKLEGYDFNTIIRKTKASVKGFSENFQKNSDRDSDDQSNRSLLANALESVAKEGEERNLLRNYKTNIRLMEAEEMKLAKVKKEAYKLRLTKGKTEAENNRLKQLESEAKAIEARINKYDRQLLKLEANSPLKAVLEREKAKAYKEAAQRGREALAEYREKATKNALDIMKHYQESRAKSVEGRHKTVVRNQLKKTVADLKRLFEKGTKERNVKIGLQESVAKALDLADILLSDEYTNEVIARHGVESVTDAEAQLLEQYNALLDTLEPYRARLDELYEQRKELKKNKATDAEIDAVNAKIESIRNNKEYARASRILNELNHKLENVFVRERNRYNKEKATTVMDGLIAAYESLKDSEVDYIRNAYQKELLDRLKAVRNTFKNVSIKDMSLKDLQDIYKAYSMVKHVVTDANKIFREGRKEDLGKRIESVQSELRKIGKERKDRPAFFEKITGWIRSFSWNNLRPVDAFERLGVKSFTELFWDAVDAQDTYARDVVEAGEVISNARAKHGYKKWDLKTAKTFKTANGLEFKLTLGDMMSIYAYSFREQAEEHMTIGGFTFDTGKTYKEKKHGVTYTHAKLDKTYIVSQETIQAIIGSLTAEQRAYVKEIQAYLTSMGEKGNEVSRILYGIDIFTEEHYFPLQSERDYRSSVEQAFNSTQTMVSLKNTGMTKATVPHANNPIVLKSFDDVVLEHIDKMSKYHAFVIPIENMQKVFNNAGQDANQTPISTQALISSIFGHEATAYFNQYITDLNGSGSIGGVRNPLASFFGKAKGVSVAANISVVAQQYFAVVRAMAEIDSKHFIPFLNGKASKSEGSSYEELKKYAPVAVLKEMGGFDIGSNRGAKDFIGMENAPVDGEYVKKKFQDATMFGASLMDRFGWVTIWKAVKKEIASTRPDLAIGSDEFLRACGRRFTEVVTRTQVYDSVNTRSGFMRSKHDSVKYLTSFMGEPTTAIGMYFTAVNGFIHALKTKDKAEMKIAKRRLARTLATLPIAGALTAMSKALVQAMRDDDEDESYFEKWIEHYTSNFKEDLNPLNFLPVFRDIMSIIEGWDVERPDMTLIADLVTAMEKVFDEDADAEDVLNALGAFGNILGIPMKTIIRDVRGFINTIQSSINGESTTSMGIENAFKEGWTGDEVSNTQQLYEAIISGDQEQIERVKARFKENGKTDKKIKSKIDSALRKGLRDNDPRIKEAAQLAVNGNQAERIRLTREIVAEGRFSQDIVVGAINAEIDAIKKKQKEQENKN